MFAPSASKTSFINKVKQVRCSVNDDLSNGFTLFNEYSKRYIE